MTRRHFLLGGAAFIGGLRRAHAEAPLFRMAVVHPTLPASRMRKQAGPPLETLFLELERAGLVEGRTLTVERYEALGSSARLDEIARAVVASKPDVIYASSGRTVLLLKRYTDTIPIVGIVSDPIAYGITASLSHPGGNVTGGVVDAGIGTWMKRLELLKEAKPTLGRVFHLAPRSAWDSGVGVGIQTEARRAGFSLIGPPVEPPYQEAEYRTAFAEAAAQADACLVNSAPENMTQRGLIVDLCLRHDLPTIYPYREYVLSGGCMSYDIDMSELMIHIARQISDISKGGNPGTMPFFQPKKFKLIVNSRCLDRAGVTLTPLLLGRVDEFIE